MNFKEAVEICWVFIGAGFLLGIGGYCAHVFVEFFSEITGIIIRFFLRLIHVIKHSRRPEKKEKPRFVRRPDSDES